MFSVRQIFFQSEEIPPVSFNQQIMNLQKKQELLTKIFIYYYEVTIIMGPELEEIKAAVSLLEKVLDCTCVSQPIETPVTTGDSQRRGLSSVKSCYEAFAGLPSDHPLKKEVDPTKVMLGYFGLEGLRFDPSRNYQELAVVIAITQRA